MKRSRRSNRGQWWDCENCEEHTKHEVTTESKSKGTDGSGWWQKTFKDGSTVRYYVRHHACNDCKDHVDYEPIRGYEIRKDDFRKFELAIAENEKLKIQIEKLMAENQALKNKLDRIISIVEE